MPASAIISADLISGCRRMRFSFETSELLLRVGSCVDEAIFPNCNSLHTGSQSSHQPRLVRIPYPVIPETRMDSRHVFKIGVIRGQIEFCLAERRRILKMVTISQVDLGWISERMECIEKDLRLLHRDLEAQEKQSQEWD